jgi:predicted signal transduction protein with EAL and GGDEF domain
MAKENRIRLFRIVRFIPYGLAVLCSILALYESAPDAMRPFEGAYYYDKLIYVFMLMLMICSIFAKMELRSIFIIISGTSILSMDLVVFFKRLREYPIQPPDGGAIYLNVWIDSVWLGLLLIVVAIEATMLIRSRAVPPYDRPKFGDWSTVITVTGHQMHQTEGAPAFRAPHTPEFRNGNRTRLTHPDSVPFD